MGGGGFASGRDEALDDYVLTLARTARPRICLLPTASGDPEDQIRRFYLAFARRECVPSHISLFRLGQHPVPIGEHLLSQDVIYVGGGSMLNLLAIWRAHELDAVLRRAWESGVVLAGISAGSMCWFEAGITKSHGPPRPAAGLGFLPGSNCVHYDAEPERRPAYLEAVETGMPSGYGVDDGAGLLFEGTELAEVVTARRGAGARRVALEAGRATDAGLDARLLLPRGAPGEPLSISEFREARARRPVSRRLGGPRAGLGD
jgi:peptidase E